jgi:toxin CcdB
MARFDVHRSRWSSVDLLVVVQVDIFDGLDTRLAIPLLPERADRRAMAKLNPTFVIHEKRYVLYTQHMLAVPVDGLKQPIGNLADHRDEIVSAVDFLQQGF